MSGLMYDSDDVTVLGSTLCINSRVATYADLITQAIIDTYRGRLVVIDRGHGDPFNVATVADIETGLLTIAQGVAKIQFWNASHRPFPTAYVNRANWAAFRAAIGTVPHWEWIATLDGTLLPEGKRPAVVQFAGEGALGFHADASVVWDDRWHPIRPAVSWTSQAAMLRQADILTKSIAGMA